MKLNNLINEKEKFRIKELPTKTMSIKKSSFSNKFL
jgi:hypothetical protein